MTSIPTRGQSSISLPLVVWVGSFLLAALGPAFSQELALETVLTGLPSPVQVTNAGDDRLFVVTQRGKILVVRNGTLLSTPFLDIEPRVLSGGERGLLSVAFDPNFQVNGRFYVNYTARPNGSTVVSRFTLGSNPDRADAASETILLAISQPFSNHNGGQIHFGADDFLYIGTGDGGSGNDPQCYAQRHDSLLGKMLRIDPNGSSAASPNYGIPGGNPFVGSGTYRDEVWAVGLRNPYRFSVDRLTGDLFVGDVGQNQIEEVDFAGFGQSGLNFGWKACEGSQCGSNVAGCPDYVSASALAQSTRPIIEYNHASGGCSVTGGYRYRGSALPAHFGHYFFGDFCNGDLRSARFVSGRWIENELDLVAQSVSSFGEDASGELYLTQLGGTLLRIVAADASGPGDGGTFSFPEGVLELDENSGDEEGSEVRVSVNRTGSFDGAVEVPIELRSQTATQGLDFLFEPQTLRWEDGDQLPKEVVFRTLDDDLAEFDERFVLVFGEITGDGIAGDDRLPVDIRDDERRSGCDGDRVLCLLNDRFAVRAEWQTEQGSAGVGNPQELTPDSGHFWFFEPENVEVVVKMIDACGPFESFWVFAAGLTDVEVRLTVVDTLANELVVYNNPQKTAFLPIDDNQAFSTCP